MLEAFEHVHVEEYIGLVRATRSKAKPKLFHILLDLAVQAVRRKNGSFLRRNHPTHPHYFTKGTVLQTMTDVGCKIVDDFYTSRCIALGDRLHKIASIPRPPCFLGGSSLRVLAE
jgi:hypothetical protein